MKMELLDYVLGMHHGGVDYLSRLTFAGIGERLHYSQEGNVSKLTDRLYPMLHGAQEVVQEYSFGSLNREFRTDRLFEDRS